MIKYQKRVVFSKHLWRDCCPQDVAYAKAYEAYVKKKWDPLQLRDEYGLNSKKRNRTF